MRNILVLAVGLLAVGTFGVSQAAKGKNSDLEQKLTSMEKQQWEAWKNHDMTHNSITDDVVFVSENGIMQGRDKLDDMMTKTPCDVKSYSLDDMKVNWVDKDAALLTYKDDVDGTCGGQRLPPEGTLPAYG